MALDPGFTGGVINALPMDKMIAGPLDAMIKAQAAASFAYADFINTVCVKDGKAVMVDFDYDETINDTEGRWVGTQKRHMSIPMMATVVHPVVCIESGTVDFELEVTQSEMENKKTGVEAELGGSVGFGPVSVNFSAKVSHSSEQTRSSDTRAKYRFHTELRRQPPPEAIMRVIEFLTNAATKPTIQPGETLALPEAAGADETVDTLPSREAVRG
ncbi:conserved hypothetical protein [Burkholderiales bacterium 8X]|nr:conserved hypothetical protein [Burkholderiales bacterium 8X]